MAMDAFEAMEREHADRQDEALARAIEAGRVATEKTRDAKEQIQGDISGLERAIEEAYREVRRKEERLEDLRSLLHYCTCPKCGAELQGGIDTAADARDEAIRLGHIPCAFCDAPQDPQECGHGLIGPCAECDGSGQQPEPEDAREEHQNHQPDSVQEAERGVVAHLGAKRPEQAWILSDRDVWYQNPFYKGPPVPHPEIDM